VREDCFNHVSVEGGLPSPFGRWLATAQSSSLAKREPPHACATRRGGLSGCADVSSPRTRPSGRRTRVSIPRAAMFVAPMLAPAAEPEAPPNRAGRRLCVASRGGAVSAQTRRRRAKLTVWRACLATPQLRCTRPGGHHRVVQAAMPRPRGGTQARQGTEAARVHPVTTSSAS
jgi:hypothetical protein